MAIPPLAGVIRVCGLLISTRRDAEKGYTMNSVPTNQQFADVLGITVDDARTHIVHTRSLPIQGCWVLTFADKTPEHVLSKLQLTQTLTCTVVLPQDERFFCRFSLKGDG